jgi:hypothetical protein
MPDKITQAVLDVQDSCAYLRVRARSRPRSCWVGAKAPKRRATCSRTCSLRRGVATFVYDGPGQGEMYFDVKL